MAWWMWAAAAVLLSQQKQSTVPAAAAASLAAPTVGTFTPQVQAPLTTPSGPVSAATTGTPMPLPSAAPAPSAAQIATQNQFVATGGVTPTAGAVDTLISQSPDGSQMWRRPNGDTYQAWASDDPSLNLSLGAAPAMSNGPAAPPSNSQANLVSQAPTAGIFMAPIISDPIVNPILFIGGPATPIINTTVDLPTPTGTASILQSSGQNVPRLATL